MESLLKKYWSPPLKGEVFGNNMGKDANGKRGKRQLTAVFAKITGYGKYLPKQVRTNFDLEKTLDTTDRWIFERTGIERRHIAETESLVEMGINAGKEALAKARLAPEKLEMVILATSTGGTGAIQVREETVAGLKAFQAASFALSAACSGFTYGISIAEQMIKTGLVQNVLVLGAEKMSQVVDWADRNTCILFGDGAGAVVLEASPEPGVVDSKLYADGVDARVLTLAMEDTIKMSGQDVFKFAVKVVKNAINHILAVNELSLDEIKLIIPHQANKRIIDSVAKSLGTGEEKFYVNLHKYGNTSSASIPIAFEEAMEEKKLLPDDLVLMVGFGGGLTWGVNLIRI
jgi:3-oxoacyl-[acyl-carrier-protein] synthase-3